MDKANTRLVHSGSTSGAEELARKVPKAKVVAAFQTVPSEVFFAVHASRNKPRPTVFIQGDDRGSKVLVARLVRDVGFEPLDVGPLRIARYSEPFGLLMAQIAYEGKGGPAVAYRIERHKERQPKPLRTRTRRTP